MYHKLKKCLNSRSSHQRCTTEKAARPATLLKETPTKVFSSEYCEIFKNTYFEENLRTTASAIPASYS